MYNFMPVSDDHRIDTRSQTLRLQCSGDWESLETRLTGRGGGGGGGSLKGCKCLAVLAANKMGVEQKFSFRHIRGAAYIHCICHNQTTCTVPPRYKV